MIQKHFWNHPFHRKILDLALWISIDCYSRWINVSKLRNSTESEVTEYIKKLNLTLTTFLLSIKEPTYMVQYYPV